MYLGKWLADKGTNEIYGVPAADQGVPDGLVQLNRMQWALFYEEDLMPLVEAIERASAEEIDLARPQLFHALEMVREFMRKREFEHSYHDEGLLKERRTAADVVDAVLEGTLTEGRATILRLETRPQDKIALERAAAALRTAAEAREVLSHMAASGGAREMAWAERATAVFAELGAAADRLRDGVGLLYAERIRAVLPSSVKADAEAPARAAAALARGPEAVSPRVVGQGIEMTGDWEPGRRMLAKLHGYALEGTPLDAARAEKLRVLVAGVLSDYDVTFHRPSFLALLRQTAVMARWEATKTVDRETVPDVALRARTERDQATRAAERAGYFRNVDWHRSEAAVPLEEREKRIATRQRNHLGSAMGYATLAGSLDAFSACAAAAVGVAPPVRTVNASRDGDVLVLRFTDERPGDRVLLVYPEERQGRSFPDAVFAAAVEASSLESGIPALDEVRDAGWASGTNFRNAEDLMISLNAEPMQEMVFGGHVTVGNADELHELSVQPVR